MRLLPESRGWRVLLLAALGGLVWTVIRLSDSSRWLLQRQEGLIEWARDGAPSDFPDDFAGPGYHDQWGQAPADVVASARAIRLAYPGIAIVAGPRTIVESGDTFIITQKLTVTGAGSAISEDFHFTWHKESMWPWSWKLREVTAPGVP